MKKLIVFTSLIFALLAESPELNKVEIQNNKSLSIVLKFLFVFPMGTGS